MRRGRAAALGAALVAVGVCLAGLLLVGTDLIDDWHIARIERGLREGHAPPKEFLDALARRRSLRAARHFLERMSAGRSAPDDDGKACEILLSIVQRLGDRQVPFLREMADHESPEARLCAVEWAAMDQRGLAVPPESALEIILPALQDPDREVRISSISYLQETLRSLELAGHSRERATTAIEGLLSDPDASLRVGALYLLTEHASPGRGLSVARPLLADPDPRARAAAYEAVEDFCASLGDAASREEARRSFTAAWSDRSATVRASALSRFLELWDGARAGAPPSADEATLLVQMLGAPAYPIRARVGTYLWNIESEGDAAVLVGAIAKGPEVAKWAALSWFALARSPYIPALRDLLDDTNGRTRSWAALVLSRLSANGCAREDQLPALLSDPEVEVRLWALGEAARLTTEGRDRLLVGALSNDSRHVRSMAAQHLRQRKAAGSEVVAALERTLGDADPETRIAASVALLEVDPSHEGAARILSGALRDAPNWTRVHALRELRTLGGKARAVEGAVEAAALDPSAEVAEHARLVLQTLRGTGR